METKIRRIENTECSYTTNHLNDSAEYVMNKYNISLMFMKPANPDGDDVHKYYSVLTGFDNFAQAEDVAKKYHLDIVRLSVRNGGHTWKDQGMVSRPLIPTELYSGDVYSEYVKGRHTVEALVEDMHDAIRGMEDEEAAAMVAHYAEGIAEFVQLEDGQILAEVSDGGWMAFDAESMRCSDEDVTQYVIGVTDYDKGDEE